MTKREVVRCVLQGQRPPYVPWSMGFTQGGEGETAAALRLRRPRRPAAEPSAETRQRHRLLRRPGQRSRARRLRRGLGPQRRPGHRQRREAACWPSRRLAGYAFPDPLDPRFFADIPAKIARVPDRFRVFQIGFSLYERAWTLRGMERVDDRFLRPSRVRPRTAAAGSPTTTSPRSARR